MKQLLHIREIAKKVGLQEEDIIYYGNNKCKLRDEILNKKDFENSKLILVTAITPTKAGEGKTMTAIALLDALNKIDKKAIAVLREPSMGPTFGLKGGATGGGMASIEPKTEINLHFTGDMHALTSTINLISAVIDNHIYQGNELNIDPSRILWKRALDCNDRELREVEIGLGAKTNGIKRTEHFTITVASELMAILCISKDEKDFLRRVSEILIGYTFDNKPVYLKDLDIEGAIYAIMKDALLPNMVQTLENNPCLVHGGPFANIAHGCASLIGTTFARKLAPIVIEEAGFASDLGAEKFYDIKCREGNLNPACTVLVATIRALKQHGGVEFENLNEENIDALKEGSKNLLKHYSNLQKFNVPVVVAINHFASDSNLEVETLKSILEENKIKYAFLDGFLKGSEGSIDLANKVLEVLDTKKFVLKNVYDLNDSIKDKITKLAKEIYNAKEVEFSDESLKSIKEIENLGKSNLYICMAKTQSSISDDPKKLNVPENYTFHVRDVYLSNGAGFIVCLAGNILTMPGLPKVPRAVGFKYE